MQLPFELERFLTEPRVAVLATVRRDGGPSTTASWFDLQGGKILITMYTSARRLANIRRDPQVAITVLGKDPYQHVSVSGRVVETWDDPELQVMDRLALRYTGATWPERKPCVSALIEIDHWHTYGLPSGSADYSSPA